MAKFPYMPYYPRDYRADTSHLTWLEHGIYRHLLDELWLAPKQRLPNDDAWLARRFREDESWVHDHLRPLIEEFCTSDGNWITQKRVTHVFAQVSERHQRQSDRAKSRWQKENDSYRGNAGAASLRHMQAKANTKTEEEESRTGISSENLSERILPTHTGRAAKKSRAPLLFDEEDFLPKWVPKDAWDAYLAMRKAKKHPATQQAIKLVILRLTELRDAGEDPEAVLNQSTRVCWTDLWPVKTNGVNGHAQPASMVMTLKEMDELNAQTNQKREH